MIRISLFVLIILFSNNASTQNFISFRNCLNEANYWFYEQNFDSALFYYQKAESFHLDFFLEEAHLYSRTLWEKGLKKSSMKILQKDGFVEFFKNDTTYYFGMTSEERLKTMKKLKSIKTDWLVTNSAFYDSLDFKDRVYRKRIRELNLSEGPLFDSLARLEGWQDSINFQEMMSEIEKNGYPGGYHHQGVTFGTLLLHVEPTLFLKHYNIFLNEIEKGRMNLCDFSRAADRVFAKLENQKHKPYNAYLPLDSNTIDSPELVFVNRCLIGMSPYYDIQSPRLFPRGKTPKNRSKLYDYYKNRKENFNCIQIK